MLLEVLLKVIVNLTGKASEMFTNLLLSDEGKKTHVVGTIEFEGETDSMSNDDEIEYMSSDMTFILIER